MMMKRCLTAGLVFLMLSMNAVSAGEQNTDKLLSFAAEIDRILNEQLTSRQIKMNDVVNDETFLRRAYLDIAGRIPTLEESRSFLDSTDKTKRHKLVDRLIDSEAHVSHMFNYWADVLRLKTRLNNYQSDNYQKFVKESIRADKPYDEFVRELLKSQGNPYAEGNGAAGYYMRDAGMPLDNLSNTMQVFNGTDMVCAQCHDHPFDNWTQKSFYELAAFNSGIRANPGRGGKKSPMMRELYQKSKEDRELRKTMRTVGTMLYSDVRSTGKGKIQLPKDYDYYDAKPNEIVKAHVPYGEKIMLEYRDVIRQQNNQNTKNKKNKKNKKNRVNLGPDIGSRLKFADWMTSPENPLFTRTIVNRLWAKAMGQSLTGSKTRIPLDDYGVMPDLMKALESQMKALNYSTRDFLRVLYKTNLYQRELHTQDIAADEDYFFPGPVLERLSAEQLWDSLVTLAAGDVDSRRGQDRAASTARAYASLAAMDDEQLKSFILANSGSKNIFKNLGGMQMMGMTNEGDVRKREDAKVNATRAEVARLKKAMKAAYKAKDKELGNNLKQELVVKNKELRKLYVTRKKRRGSKTLLRASELPSPAPNGHFLRRFGQGDREVIEDFSTEASVPQAMALMNGEIEGYLIANRHSRINEQIDCAKEIDGQIELAYLSILSRQPKPSEKDLFSKAFVVDSVQGRKDLIWVLVNSNEFRFRK